MPTDQDLADAFVAGAEAMRAECVAHYQDHCFQALRSRKPGAFFRARPLQATAHEIARVPVPTLTLKGSRPDAE